MKRRASARLGKMRDGGGQFGGTRDGGLFSFQRATQRKECVGILASFTTGPLLAVGWYT